MVQEMTAWSPPFLISFAYSHIFFNLLLNAKTQYSIVIEYQPFIKTILLTKKMYYYDRFDSKFYAPPVHYTTDKPTGLVRWSKTTIDPQ